MKFKDKLERGSENYCKDLEDKKEDDNLEDSIEPNFEKLYYRHMKDTKISYEYVHHKLLKSKAMEEKYKVEKMIIQAQESMID